MAANKSEKIVPHPNRPPFFQYREFCYGAAAGYFLSLLLLAGAGVATTKFLFEWSLSLSLKTPYFALLALLDHERFAHMSQTAQIAWMTYSVTLILLPIFLSIVAGWSFGRPGKDGLHARGRKLSYDAHDANSALADDRKRSGGGLYIHPEVQLSLDAETKHIVFAGATGAGKTVTMLPLINQAIQRHDKCIIFDQKPQFTALFSGAIFAPWDSRGVAWDVGADVLDSGDADTLASRLIAESSDPTWSEGARSILAAAICQLQEDHEKNWDLQKLVQLLASDNHLKAALERQNPMAARLLSDLQSKTAQSFLMTMSSQLKPLLALAQNWTHKKKFSLRRFLLDENSAEAKCKTIILSANDRYKTLAQAYIQSILSCVTSLINSPEIADSKKRRLWMFLDEAPRLGKVDEIEQLLAAGRSKGVRVVVGVQDISQLRELYSKDTAAAWASLFGTWIVTQIAGEESPKWFSGLLGEREVWRYTASISRDFETSSISDNWQREKTPVVHPDHLTDRLGPHKNGIRAILWRPGAGVYQLDWPFFEIKEKRALYLAHKALKMSELTQPSPENDAAAGGDEENNASETEKNADTETKTETKSKAAAAVKKQKKEEQQQQAQITVVSQQKQNEKSENDENEDEILNETAEDATAHALEEAADEAVEAMIEEAEPALSVAKKALEAVTDDNQNNKKNDNKAAQTQKQSAAVRDDLSAEESENDEDENSWWT